jgi:cell division topological specificity factor
MSSGLFNFFRGRKEPASRDVAKQRLQLVLVHDRSNISPGLLETLKGEIIDVISKRVEIDGAATQISFTQTRTEIKLVADIPLLDGRPRKPHERTGGQ